MAEQFPTNYRMVKCSRCGAMSAVELRYCRKCDADLSKTGAATVPIWLVVAVVGLILLAALLVVAGLLFDVGSAVALAFVVPALILMMVGNLWFLFEAFRENVLWGLACLFLPFASLLFLILHAQRAVKPIILMVVGAFLLILGILFVPS